LQADNPRMVIRPTIMIFLVMFIGRSKV
jgi:hypothetical protein